MKNAHHFLYRIPLIGYAARWLAGAVRLPDRFASYDAQLLELHHASTQARQREASLAHALAALQGAIDASLPAIRHELNAFSRTAVDARDQANVAKAAFDQHLPAFLNVVSSSQAALRLIRRQQAALQEEMARSAAGLRAAIEDSARGVAGTRADLERRLADMQTRASAQVATHAANLAEANRVVAGLSVRLAKAEAEIPDAPRREGALASDFATGIASMRKQLAAVEARLEGIVATLAAAAGEDEVAKTALVDLQSTTSYLLGRVEFVRRELMFELRYRSGGDAAAAPAKRKILNARKVNAAMKKGLRLNVGCGHLPMQEYVNVDLRELPGVDVLAEATDLPFKPGAVSEIYSSHLLEHFPQEQLIRQVLPHWKELLKAGGVLRAVVPDAQAMIAEYGKGGYPYEDLREVTFGGQDYDGDFHYNMFTPASLGEVLTSAGFSSYEILATGRRNGRCYEFEARARAAAS